MTTEILVQSLRGNLLVADEANAQLTLHIAELKEVLTKKEHELSSMEERLESASEALHNARDELDTLRKALDPSGTWLGGAEDAARLVAGVKTFLHVMRQANDILRVSSAFNAILEDDEDRIIRVLKGGV